MPTHLIFLKKSRIIASFPFGKNESKYGWLKSGDTVSITISGIGTLENKFI